jgi:predicted peptidase
LLTDVVFNQFSVDMDRLYITGISMGGYGLMSYLEYFNYQHPDLLQFAAGVPLAGAWPYGDSAVWEEYRQTPLWLIHGGADSSREDSRYTYRTLTGLDFDDPILFTGTAIDGEPTTASGKTRYTEITGRGHDIWPDVYSSNDFYDWMFAQSLAVPEPSAISIAAAVLGSLAVVRPRRLIVPSPP